MNKAPLPSWLQEKLAQETEHSGNNGYFDMARAVAGVAKGERDTQMFKLACLMRSTDVPRDLAEASC